MTVTTKSTSLALRYSKTLADLSTKVGANREITVCDEDKRPYLHDGVTAGGIPLAMQSDLEGLGEGGSAQTAEEIEASLDTYFGSTVWRRSPDLPNLAPQSYSITEGDLANYWLGPRTDNFGNNIVYEVTGSTDFTVVLNTIDFSSNTLGLQVLQVTATGSAGGVGTTTMSVTVLFRENTAPQFADKNITELTGREVKINLGPERDIDNDLITYTVTSGETFVQTARELTYTTSTLGEFVFNVAIVDEALLTSSYTITLNVIESLPDGVSSYVTNTDVIAEDYGAALPDKMVPFVQPVTGCRVTRVTNAPTDMQQTTDAALNGYSRYTQENSDQSLYLAQGSNSTSCTIFNKYSGEVVAYLAYDDTGLDTHTIGMAHEVRWDKSGDHPNRVYFKMNAKFYMIDDVTQNNNTDRSNPTRSVIKDFDPLITWPAEKGSANGVIYNDQEGDSSDDSDHWVWMAAYYDGSNYQVAAFVHYQISSDTTHIMYPADLAGTNMDAFKGDPYFPKKPNMVEVSPLGTGIVIHTGRSWGTMNTVDTWFDGPHLWPLDFDHATVAPFKISIDESHSGWAYGDDGREMFVYQDNRRDVISATYISGTDKGYGLTNAALPNDDAGAGTVDFYKHEDISWTGMHFGRMPPSKKGWIQMSTYGEGGNSGWANDQILMFRIKPYSSGTRVWRVASMYNNYQGNYWDEGPASISNDGNSIYVSGNWGAAAGRIETYRYDLPSDWVEHFDVIHTTYFPTITVTGVGVS